MLADRCRDTIFADDELQRLVVPSVRGSSVQELVTPLARIPRFCIIKANDKSSSLDNMQCRPISVLEFDKVSPSLSTVSISRMKDVFASSNYLRPFISLIRGQNANP